MAVHSKIIALLESNTPVALGDWSGSEVEIIKEKYDLITTKPIVYLVNLNKRDFCRSVKSAYVRLCMCVLCPVSFALSYMHTWFRCAPAIVCGCVMWFRGLCCAGNATSTS